MHGEPKKLVGAHLFPEDDGKDGFRKGCALIRANLGTDPEACSPEEWAARYAEALWIEQFRNRNLAGLLAGLFGGTGGT